MFEDVGGFDWDSGNWPKCGKHGVSKEEIEELFHRFPGLFDDPCQIEKRFKAVGSISTGRYIYVVFGFRIKGDIKLIRPISARYMHQKEIERYARYTS